MWTSTKVSTLQVRAPRQPRTSGRGLHGPEQSRSANLRCSTCRAQDLDGSERCRWTQWIKPALRVGLVAPFLSMPVHRVVPRRPSASGALHTAAAGVMHSFTLFRTSAILGPEQARTETARRLSCHVRERLERDPRRLSVPDRSVNEANQSLAGCEVGDVGADPFGEEG